MKKSIFLIFAAILCAMTANAQWALMGTLTDWSSGKAMTVSGTTATCTVDLPGKTTYTLKVKNGSKWYGRNSTTISATTTTNAFSTSGGDVTLNTDIPGTYTFSFNTSTLKLTVTYPTAPAPHDITVRAQVPASWTNTITAWVWTSENATGEEVTPTKDGDYYVVTKNAGALYVIFKNGAGWNGDKNQTVDLCYTEDVCLQLNQSDANKATATVIDCGAVAKDITIKAVVPGAWEETITAWVWPTGGAGKAVTATKNGNWYEITENCIELNAIFRNGTDWNGNENQTVDITGVTENTCYQISALNKVDGKCSVTEVDCEAAIEPEAKPEPTPTYDYYVVGSFNSWNTADANYGMTKDGDVYKKEVTFAAATEFKVCNGSWASAWGINNLGDTKYLELEGADNIVMKEEKTFTVIFNPAENLITFDGLTVDVDAVIYDYYVIGTINGWATKDENFGMTDENADGVYEKEITLAAGENEIKVNNGTWDDGFHWGFGDLTVAYEETSDNGGNILVTLAAEKAITVIFDSNTKKITLDGLTPAETKYYIAGTENLTGFDWQVDGLKMTEDAGVYKHTFSALAAGTFEFKVTNGTWTNPWGFGNLSAAYVEVSEGTDGEGNPNGNIKFVTEEAKNITVIFNPATGKITIDGLTEKAPAADVTVYFINSGEWAEVACYYWGGPAAATWPGVQMTATGEVYEAEGWNVYAITFPGDNTSCIFNDNKAEGATQTGNLEVHDGQYYCYANGIWYERLADVDPLDTRVYLKGDMNEWCATEGWCDMFRKETVDGTVAYRTVYLEEAKTYEFKIEDAGTWLSNEGTMTKDNCTGWLFEEGLNNAKITIEYAGEYTFEWNMETKHLSVVYPELTPEVMDLMVTDMVFDGAGTFSGTDNMMGIEFTLVVGSELEDGVYSLDASSTVNFGGTLFTDVTGMIAPDTETFASASAVVYGFYGSMYFQLNVEMSAGGSAGVPVEILDGTASVNGAGELWITGQWEGDDVYVQAPGFPGESFECDEAWFYVGGTDWETASIIAFGPATITVDGNDVLVEGTVMSGMTGTNYDLFVIGTLADEPEPAETETVYFVNVDDWTGTISAYAYSPENATWPGVAATKETYQIAGHDVYSYTAEKGKYANVIFTNKNDGDKQTADLTWTAGKYYVNYGSVTGWFTKDEAESKLAAPAENVYTIVGDLVGGWDVNATQYDMQATGNENEYVLILTNQTIKKGTYGYKVVCNHAWGTGEYPTSGNQQGNIPEDGVYTLTFTYVVGTSLTVDAQKTGDATIEAKYYIAGELPGTAWDPKSFEMTANGSIYSATFENVPAATYSFRVTSGNWNPSWGYSHMEGVYSEISQGDNDNNFKLTLTEATTFTVKFDSENEKITFEDLTAVAVDAVTAFTVTVPAGTEKCYIVGDFAESNWSTFIEMDKVVGEDNKFTLEVGAGKKIASATTVNQYKYTCGEAWMYEEDIADNRTWTNNDNVTAWKAIPGVVVDLSNQPATLYFRPSTSWKSDNARFAAYFFGTEEKWADMTDSNADGVYEVANEKTNANVIFCRMNPDAADNKWENKWNQTGDLEIPNTAGDLNTCYTFWKNNIDDASGIWVVPTSLTDANWSTFVSTYNGQTINAVVERSFNAGQNHTLCLPFDLPTNWLGDDAEAYQLSSVVANSATELSLTVTSCATILAGQPYIVVPTKNAEYENLVVSGVTVKNVTAGTNAVTGGGVKATLKAVTTTGGQTNGSTEYYIGANDGYLYKTVTNKLGLRALIELTKADGTPVQIRARVVAKEDVETGFDNIVAPEGQTIKAIVNGQLVIIRGGEMYNVQGQKL